MALRFCRTRAWLPAGQTARSRSLLFYIRFVTYPVAAQPRGTRRSGGTITPFPAPVDDLEHAVEPFKVRLYDASSTQQFRMILAVVLDQISRI